MSDLYSNDKVREKAEQLVQQNVHYCVSMLIHQIANPDQPGQNRSYSQNGLDSSEVCFALGLSWDDDLMPLLEVTDYEEAAERHIDDDMDADELREYLTDQGLGFEAPVLDDDGDEVEGTGAPIEMLRQLTKDWIESEHNGYQDFCEEHNIEPDRSDVYEHWIVDQWFASKLEEKGQPIARDFLGMTIWGRPTTGQSISMDGVILEIANELLKED